MNKNHRFNMTFCDFFREISILGAHLSLFYGRIPRHVYVPASITKCLILGANTIPTHNKHPKCALGAAGCCGARITHRHVGLRCRRAAK